MIELKDFMQNNTRNRISIAAFEKNIIKRNILVFLEKLLGITVIDKLYGESIAKNTNDNFWSSAIKVWSGRLLSSGLVVCQTTASYIRVEEYR